MNPLYSELQWLPRAPRDFAQILKCVGDSGHPLGRELRALALHALDLNQLTKLSNFIGKTRSDGKSHTWSRAFQNYPALVVKAIKDRCKAATG